MKTFLLFLVLATFAMAADITGVWKAEVPGRDGGTREVTFNFKQDGEKLTGSMSGFRGAEITITDGKVTGDDVAFDIVREFNGNSMKMQYRGKVAGSEIKFKQTREGGENAREFTAKKSS